MYQDLEYLNNPQTSLVQVRGKLTKLERKTIGALIVIDVHARDVVKILADTKVSSEIDFDWISQLRWATHIKHK